MKTDILKDWYRFKRHRRNPWFLIDDQKYDKPHKPINK